MEFDKVLDNGDRQEFETGSKRDIAEGKGMPHLLPGEVMADIIKGESILSSIEHLLFKYNSFTGSETDEQDMMLLRDAATLTFRYLMAEENKSIYHTMVRFSKHYENGAKKYGDNNWRKGQPISRYYDSAMRHLWKLMDNDIEEDHASALLWNLTCILQTKKDVARGFLPESIDDFPYDHNELFGK